MYAIQMASDDMAFIPSFMKIYTGVQEILRLHLTILRRRNVGITEELDFWYVYKLLIDMTWPVLWRPLQTFKQY
jgi:hypothetical protein